MIEVRLYASLRQSRPSVADQGLVTVDVPDGISLGELLDELEMATAQVKQATVNGVDSDLERVLFDGDRVALYPAADHARHL
ncbi:MAG: MoaD/ThiS family protein [Negativicutes bacterium]|nr:MoaD/ThiS family protein [Negativicutes bacterium]